MRGEKGLEHLQPGPVDRMKGAGWLEKMTDVYSDKRNAIIQDHIWRRYAQPLVQQIIEGAEKQARQYADQEEKNQQGQGQQGEGQQGQGQQGQGQQGQGQQGQGKQGEGKQGEGKQGEGKQGEGKQGEGKQGEGKQGEGKQGEGKQGEGLPSENIVPRSGKPLKVKGAGNVRVLRYPPKILRK
jgi:hypothetical protein